MIRTYHDMVQHREFEDRYNYLRLRSRVGTDTFGFDRYMNQQFYKSFEWRNIRDLVIARDNGCDLGVKDYEIYDRIIIHHMNPMVVDDIKHGNDDILNPEYLITTNHKTHNAIHYGDASQLLQLPPERRRGDTKLW